MGEDAAAAARRIVEEVLAQHGTPSDDGADVAGETGASELAPTIDVAPTTEVDRPTPAGSPPDAETIEEVVSEAQRIARRIVDEVLAAEAEVSVRGVPRDGLPAEGERTARIVTETAPTAGDGVESPDAGPDRSPDDPAPGADPGSADIVRSIVADVRTEADPSPAGSPDAAADDTVHLAGSAGQPEAAATGATPGRTSGTVEMPVGASEPDVADPAAATAVADDSAATRVVPRGAGSAEPPSDGTGGPVAIAGDERLASARPLVGWASPPEPETEKVAAPGDEDTSPRSLRWLVASLLGAVALAVLFPLAVAALRALVSL